MVQVFIQALFGLIILNGCGGAGQGNNSTGLGDSSNGSSNSSSNSSQTSSSCSQDGSETLVPGTYVFALSSSVSSKQKTQVKILKADCSYCFESVTEGESTALSSDGKWTSKLGTKNSTNGQQINITAGSVLHTLSGDGQILSESSSVWSKTRSNTYTCN